MAAEQEALPAIWFETRDIISQKHKLYPQHMDLVLSQLDAQCPNNWSFWCFEAKLGPDRVLTRTEFERNLSPDGILLLLFTPDQHWQLVVVPRPEDGNTKVFQFGWTGQNQAIDGAVLSTVLAAANLPSCWDGSFQIEELRDSDVSAFTEAGSDQGECIESSPISAAFAVHAARDILRGKAALTVDGLMPFVGKEFVDLEHWDVLEEICGLKAPSPSGTL